MRTASITALLAALAVAGCANTSTQPPVSTAPSLSGAPPNTEPQSPNSLPPGAQVQSPFTPSVGNISRSTVR